MPISFRNDVHRIWTAQFRYPGGGDPIFAPPWDIVQDFKENNITWVQYTERYIELMRLSYLAHKDY